MEKIYRGFIVAILLSMSFMTFGQNNKVFIMVHFEAGRDTTHPLINQILFDELGYLPDSLRTNNLYFQQMLWPSVVDLVQTADSFNIKLTLGLQSQMAEYIIQDPNKINIVSNWVNNGHEIAMHHHSIGHIDWGGYTNRFQSTPYPDDSLWLNKFQNSGLYRGNMSASFNYLQQLATAINDSIVTGTIGDTQIDKPEGIIYLTKGGEDQADLIASPDTVPIPNNPLYFLSHYQVVSVYKDSNDVIIENDSINHQLSTQASNYVMSNINQINNDEIMGIVFHVFDYYRFPDIYRNLFIFFNQNQVNNKSVKGLMNENLPLTIEELEPLRAEALGDGHVELKWATASEVNNKGFEIQRSSDGRNFRAIGFVPGKSNSFSNNHYAAIDSQPSVENYYRYKQIDFDGTYGFSNVVFVRVEKKVIDNIIVYPNPLSGNLVNVEFDLKRRTDLSIQIYDVNGKVCVSKEFDNFSEGKHHCEIERLDLKSGIYFVKLIISNGVITKIIVVE